MVACSVVGSGTTITSDKYNFFENKELRTGVVSNYMYLQFEIASMERTLSYSNLVFVPKSFIGGSFPCSNTVHEYLQSSKYLSERQHGVRWKRS